MKNKYKEKRRILRFALNIQTRSQGIKANVEIRPFNADEISSKKGEYEIRPFDFKIIEIRPFSKKISPQVLKIFDFPSNKMKENDKWRKKIK